MAGLLPMLQDASHRPLTMLWPTDAALQALPPDRQAWLYHEDHRDRLAAILRGHVIRNMEALASDLPNLGLLRTMHGTPISFSCSRGRPGELMVGEDDARIVQRYLAFEGGLAYGIDQLLEPPGLGARCDRFETRPLRLKICSVCGQEPPCPEGSREEGSTETCWRYPKLWTNALLRPFMLGGVWVRPSYWGQPQSLDRGCQRSCVTTIWKPTCCPGHYGSECQACRCMPHGRCDEGLGGSGSCFCDEGWTGPHCEVQLELQPVCTPPCASQAMCRAGNHCECGLGYEGDGRVCTVADLCQDGHGGCSEHANCSQVGTVVTCACLANYEGDGWSCRPRNPCADSHRGGCSEHADCLYTGPNTRRCKCHAGYVGDGLQCLEEAEPPVDRCLGRPSPCHSDAVCTDLHFQEKWAGVFHLQATSGQYGLNFSEAEAACGAQGAVLASFSQLSAAQQMLLDYANATKRGLDFLGFLDDELTYKTLFVPVNEAFVNNMTLSGPDLELHASNTTFLHTNATQGTLLPAHSGLSLVISDVGPDNSSWAPAAPGTVVVRHIIVWDIIAFNGIIHALASPLMSPPQAGAVIVPESLPVAASVGAVVVIGALLCLVAAALYLRVRGKPAGFGFSTFQAEDDADDDFAPWQEGPPTLVSVPNPVFGSHDAVCEPFDDSLLEDDFPDTQRILAVK